MWPLLSYSNYLDHGGLVCELEIKVAVATLVTLTEMDALRDQRLGDDQMLIK